MGWSSAAGRIALSGAERGGRSAYGGAVQLAPVPVGHPEVAVIQPTWHCLKRFRERHRSAPGVDTAVAGLEAALRDAEITTRPPHGVGRRGDWSLWAVAGALAFPLVDQGGGRFVAPTCLAAGRPA